MRIGAFDIEHSQNVFRPWEEGFYISCICAVDSDGVKQTWWVDHKERQPHLGWVQEFQAWLDQMDVVCAHNLKHDMNILRYCGVSFENVKLHCTMVAEYLLSGQNVKNERFNLNDVCLKHKMQPKLDIVRTQYWEKGTDTYEIPHEILEEYCMDDTLKVWHLYFIQTEDAKKQKKQQLLKLQNEFTLSLSDMELNGFGWDQDLAHEIHREYQQKVSAISFELRQIAGDSRINFGSSDQLAAFLFGGECKMVWYDWVCHQVKKYPNETKYYEKKFEETKSFKGVFKIGKRHPRTKGGSPKTDKNTIKELVARTKKQRQVKELLLALSENQKVADTLLGQKGGLCRKVGHDDRIHSKFNQAVTATGRLSSSDPNGQNFPRGSTSPIKTCIIPTLDLIGQIDLSQVEWKGAGEVSNDQTMIKEINSGVDQHNASCVDLMEQELNKENRTHAKIFNFRMIYGGTYFGYYKDAKMPDFSVEKWKAIVDSFHRKYFGLERYNSNNITTVLKGGTVRIFTGRDFVFNKTLWKDGIWQYNERQIKNFPIQGLAGGDLLPLTCCVIRRGMKKLKLKSKMFITVHDSIGFDIHKPELQKLATLCLNVAKNLHKYVESYWGYKCKVTNWGGEFEVGPNYGALEKWETK